MNRDGYAMLTIIPPRREGFIGAPRDVVFVLDRSGSMGGVKMASASRACSILLSTLGPRDNFAVCTFSDSTEWMGWTAADEAGIAAGGKFLRKIVAGGGTELDPAIKETFGEIRKRPEPIGREPVIVLITDGEVGNESDIFKRLQRDKAGVRVFTIGIDSAVNDAFLRRLAALGGGTCTLCAPGEALEQALSSVGREIGVPVFTDVGIGGADLIAPSHVPDLFAGRAVTAFLVGRNLKNVRVRMRSAVGAPGDAASRDMSLNVSAEEIDMPAIAHLWARARITDLEDRFRLGEKVKQEIIDLSVKHTLLTRFTAFVVIDESEVVNEKGEYRSVVQPVDMPDLWEFQAPSNILNSTPFLGAVGKQMLGKLQRSTPTPAEGFFSQIFGSRESWDTDQPDVHSRPAAPKAPSAAERAAIGKAMSILASALKDARDKLETGEVPSAEPIEQARQAVIHAIAKSDSNIAPDGLQRFLRRTLVTLISAIASGRPDVVRPILDRVQTELDLLTRPRKFWEASV